MAGVHVLIFFVIGQNTMNISEIFQLVFTTFWVSQQSFKSLGKKLFQVFELNYLLLSCIILWFNFVHGSNSNSKFGFGYICYGIRPHSTAVLVGRANEPRWATVGRGSKTVSRALDKTAMLRRLQSWTKLLRKLYTWTAFFWTSKLYRFFPLPLPLKAMFMMGKTFSSSFVRDCSII